MWIDLSPQERRALYDRYYTNKEKIEKIAEEVGMKPETLSRRLRELKSMSDIPAQDKITIDKLNENTVSVESKSSRILSPEDLVAHAGIDMTVWAIDHSEVNKWEGYRKDVQKDLVWDGGQIQKGRIYDEGKLRIEPLFQVKVWLVRKKPVAVEPVIHPVRINYTFSPREKTEYNDSPVKSALIIPDVHIGFRKYRSGIATFHDRVALDIVAQISENYEFDDVVLLGDFLDLPEWTDKFIRKPDLEQLTQPALEEGSWWLCRFRDSQPSAKFGYVPGNHENRIEDTIALKLPQIYGVRGKSVDSGAWTIRNLLDLDGLGISWSKEYPNGEVWLTENLKCIHGSCLGADKIVGKTDVSTIFGHIHRLESASRVVYTKGGPKTLTAFCPGFLGKIDGEIPGVKDNQNWTQGFAVVNYTEEQHVINHIPIVNGRAVFDRQLWVGQDRTEQICADLDWN